MDLFFQKIIGWSCRPASAASAAGRICAKSATQLVGFARKSSCCSGTKYVPLRFISSPMPAAAPASASFVDTAMSTGRPFRLWLLTASVGAVSYMPQASLPSVLPVHGARISRSSSYFGPMGSACAIV